jgi:hypothetical protein
MDKTLRTVIIVCICVITFSVFYYFVIYLPNEKATERAEIAKKEEAAKAEAEIKDIEARAEVRRKELDQSLKESQKMIAYHDCLRAVRQDYSSNFKGECERLKKDSDCALPLAMAQSLGKTLKDAEERCLKESQQGL